MSRIRKVFGSIMVLSLILTFTVLSSLSAASEGNVTILFTHDLHDHLQSYTTVQKNGITTTLGGFGKLQSAIKEERDKDPDLILVDAGDFSMGTLFQTIFSSHAPQLRIMGQMSYDAITFGNHEFDFRAKGLADSLTAAKSSGEPLPRITAANIFFPVDKEGKLTPSLAKLKNAMDNYKVEDYLIIERKGIKIGIFGLMGKDAASNAPMSEVKFLDAIESAQRVVNILKTKENVDLILCLSHSGTGGFSPKTEDEILAKKVPEIDVIISGHSHTKLTEPLIVGNTIIGSSGEYSQNLGIIKITQDPDESWILKEYALKPIDETIPEDEEIADMISYYQHIVQESYLNNFNLEFDEVLARSPFNFTPAAQIGQKHTEEPLGSLISDAYIYAVQLAEGEDYEPIAVSLVPNGTIRGSIVEGDVSVSDVFIVSSLGIGKDGTPGYPLVSVYLTGKELKTVCEVDASVTPIMKAAQLYMSGISYTFNPHRLIFNKVTDVNLQHPDGSLEEIDDDKLYRLVAGLYSGQMLPAVSDKSFGLLSLVPKTKDSTPIINFEDQIIKDHQGREVKEWYAIAQYLRSFDLENGIPVIPLSYSETQGRKIVDNSKNLLLLLGKPNKIAIVVYLIFLALVVGLCFLIIQVAKRYIEKRKNKYTAIK